MKLLLDQRQLEGIPMTWASLSKFALTGTGRILAVTVVNGVTSALSVRRMTTGHSYPAQPENDYMVLVPSLLMMSHAFDRFLYRQILNHSWIIFNLFYHHPHWEILLKHCAPLTLSLRHLSLRLHMLSPQLAAEQCESPTSSLRHLSLRLYMLRYPLYSTTLLKD